MSQSPDTYYPRLLMAALVIFVTGLALISLPQKSLNFVSRSEKELRRSAGPGNVEILPAKFSSEDKVKFEEWTARLPLAFEVNRGQTESRVKFFSRANGSELALTASGAILRLRDSRDPFTLQFPGANPRANVIGRDQLPGCRNYLLGNDAAKWQTNVPTFRSVVYEEVYPGINLTYYGNRRDLEYDFELAPGADPHVIRLAFDSHARPSLSQDGDLVLQSGKTELFERKPLVYQEINGERRMIEGHYVLLGNQEAGFAVDEYDRTQPLVIDPTLV